MPKNVMCKNCNNYRKNWCERVLDDPDPNLVRDCRHFWEKTNADCIRANLENDEELAALYVRYNPYTDMYHTDAGVFTDFVSAMDAELEWLKQPVEVDNG